MIKCFWTACFIVSLICSRATADESAGKLAAAANNGDASAQAELAVVYRDGKGVARDYPRAMHWAHLAADQGNAPAEDFLGYAYLRGVMVPANPDLAFGYFHAAAKESAQGAFNLGQCYFGAQGTDLDIPRALGAWEHAADMGHGYAAAEAAMICLSGEGVPADPAEALRLATRSAELKDPSGLVVLGEIQFRAGKIDQARASWQKAAGLRPVGKTGQPTQPGASMSAQEGADLLKLIDYRGRKSEPGVFAYVNGPHLHQGYNNCGATSAAMLARFEGSKLGAWDFKKLCPSPVGTGTDWAELIAAAGKIGLHWKLMKFPPDDGGFAAGTAFLRSELDAGRPVVVDFTFTGADYPGGHAGHTLDVCGYIAGENLYILRNPAIATPGLELITADDLKLYWQSRSYSAQGHGNLVRPAIAIVPAGSTKPSGSTTSPD
jgi:hypothetical protein